MASDPYKTTLLDVRCIDEIIGFIKNCEQLSPTSVADSKSFNFDDEDKKQDLRKRVNAAAILFLENIICNTLTIMEHNYRMTVLKSDVEAALRHVLLVHAPVEIEGKTADSELDVDDEEYCDNGEEDGNEEDEELEEDFHNQEEDEVDSMNEEVLVDEVRAGNAGEEAKKEFDALFPPVKDPIFMSDDFFHHVVLGPIIEGFRVPSDIVTIEAAGLIKQTMYAYIVGSVLLA